MDYLGQVMLQIILGAVNLSTHSTMSRFLQRLFVGLGLLDPVVAALFVLLAGLLLKIFAVEDIPFTASGRHVAR